MAKGAFIEGADDSHKAGDNIDAGLPNITGEVKPNDQNYGWGAGTEASGAFTDYYRGFSHIGGTNWSGDRGNGFKFNASRCSSIYGNSDTVQPKAYVSHYWLRVK